MGNRSHSGTAKPLDENLELRDLSAGCNHFQEMGDKGRNLEGRRYPPPPSIGFQVFLTLRKRGSVSRSRGLDAFSAALLRSLGQTAPVPSWPVTSTLNMKCNIMGRGTWPSEQPLEAQRHNLKVQLGHFPLDGTLTDEKQKRKKTRHSDRGFRLGTHGSKASFFLADLPKKSSVPGKPTCCGSSTSLRRSS